MTVVPFPDPVTRYQEEIEDALEPLRAICLAAAERLSPNQRFELETRLIEASAIACSGLTEGLERPRDEEVARTLEALRGILP